MHKEIQRPTPIPFVKRHSKFSKRPIRPPIYVVISPDAAMDSGTMNNPPIHVALKRSSGYQTPLRRSRHFITTVSERRPASGDPTVKDNAGDL